MLTSGQSRMDFLERFVSRVCVLVPEYRGPRLSYPVGSLLLGMLLCECAGRFAQRSKAKWLKKHWRWIKKIWSKFGGERIEAEGTPSQSTISRLLAEFSEETFARLVFQNEREQIWAEWRSYRAKCKAETIDRRKKKARQGAKGTEAPQAQGSQAAPAVLLRRQSAQGLPKRADRPRRDRRHDVLPRDHAGTRQADPRRQRR